MSISGRRKVLVPLILAAMAVGIGTALYRYSALQRSNTTASEATASIKVSVGQNSSSSRTPPLQKGEKVIPRSNPNDSSAGPPDQARLAAEVKAFTREFGGFLAKSKLSALDQEALMRLAAERALLVVGLAERFSTRSERDEYYHRESNRINELMKRLAGDEYPEFAKASQQIPIKRELAMFKYTLGNDIPLTPGQEQLLVEVTWAAYKNQGVDYFLSPLYSRIEVNSKSVEQMERRTNAYREVREVAGDFLTDSQISHLKQFQLAQVEGIWQTMTQRPPIPITPRS